MMSRKLQEQIEAILKAVEENGAPEATPEPPQNPGGLLTRYASTTQHQWRPIDDKERAKVLIDAYHERQGLKDLWPITGVEHYVIDAVELYIVVCTRVTTMILPDETIQHRCFVHCDVVIKRGGALSVAAPCDDQEGHGVS